MSGWNCPVEGCGFGDEQDRSRGSVLSHINAKADSDHDRAARTAVQEADEPPVALTEGDDDPDSALERADSADERASEQGDEGASSGSSAVVDEADGEEQGEQPAEGAESADSGASEQGESGADEAEMATPDEYEQQRTRSTGEQSGEEGASSGDSESDDESDTEQGSSGGFPALDTRTVLLVVGAVAVAVAVYWFVLRDEDGDPEVAMAGSDEERDESAQQGETDDEPEVLWDE